MRTQEALYDEIDLDLSWSERALPERERTKHVHRLHPYLGKFIPQLVEVLLERYVPRSGHVLDPFAGSGTTLVQALESGYDATGVDVAAFNALLVGVKTAEYNVFALEHDLRAVARRTETLPSLRAPAAPSAYVRRWYAPRARSDLLNFRSWIDDFEHGDVLRVVLARAARSARRTTHFDLDFPRTPQTGAYWCHKHRRECRPIDRADHFLRRYALDTVARVKSFARVRSAGRTARILHGDARQLDLGGPYHGVITSPPYPGLIDYHEQHRYAYELLGLEDRGGQELGKGATRRAVEEYVDGVAHVLARAAATLREGAKIVVVVNDRRDLYGRIFERAGLELEHRSRRHVNRRTGRRGGEFFEDVLVARPLSHN